ncbi:MAG: DUF1648 domain-containing protein [Rikenellaceae bacterium]
MNVFEKCSKSNLIIEALSLFSLLLTFAPLFFYNSLCAGKPIPIHYNINGEIDGWGSSSFLFYLALLALVTYVFFSVIPKFPKFFNYPVKVTTDNAKQLSALATGMLLRLKFLVILMFAYINNISVYIAMGNDANFNVFVLSAFMIVIFATVAVFFMKMMKLK